MSIKAKRLTARVRIANYWLYGAGKSLWVAHRELAELTDDERAKLNAASDAIWKAREQLAEVYAPRIGKAVIADL